MVLLIAVHFYLLSTFKIVLNFKLANQHCKENKDWKMQQQILFFFIILPFLLYLLNFIYFYVNTPILTCMLFQMYQFYDS
jgi:hypothetical protein